MWKEYAVYWKHPESKNDGLTVTIVYATDFWHAGQVFRKMTGFPVSIERMQIV